MWIAIVSGVGTVAIDFCMSVSRTILQRVRNMNLVKVIKSSEKSASFCRSWSAVIAVFVLLISSTIQAQELEVNPVKTVLDNRCTVCHGCYDAPCQLKFSAYDGLLRGASKTPIYNQSRFTSIAPTRLFVDATTEAEWRNLGFFSVADQNPASASSVLEQMLVLKNEFDVPEGEPLPAEFPLDINRELSCPAPSDIGAFVEEHSQFGMPYGMAPLADEELAVLQQWATDGFPQFDTQQPVPDQILEQIAEWESFLNSLGDKQALISRYIYEHLFLGYLTFDNHQSERYFRLIRSYTPTGSDPIEIATLHPNDGPPTSTFYYRIIPIRETSLDKTHFSYAMDARRLQRLADLFFADNWSVSRMPDYSDEEASNPFVAFQDIPVRARYEFLLDDALYFISNFIKGPVCRGQVALNVIPDHFFVGFLSPDYDLSVMDPGYLSEGKDSLGLPSREVGLGDHLQVWLDRLQAHRDYLEHRENAYGNHPITRDGFPLEAIWQGNSEGDDSLLTIFRHFDSATVVPGLVGATPRTAWVIDFPTLERIYYDLVVNFDVFGNLSHQLLTRLYMDYLRMESEGLFLAFLPPGTRQLLLEEWYRGMDAQMKVFWAHSNLLFQTPSRVTYQTGSYVEELFTLIQQATDAGQHLQGLGDTERLAHTQLQTLDNNFSANNSWVGWIPELSYILLYDNENELNEVATLLRNKAHRNVSFIFFEEDRRIPAEDTTTLTFGSLGSYPNFFFKVSIDEVEQFVIDLRSVVDQRSMTAVVEQYGIRRTDHRIWESLDDLHALRKTETGRSDLLDMNRYLNL